MSPGTPGIDVSLVQHPLPAIVHFIGVGDLKCDMLQGGRMKCETFHTVFLDEIGELSKSIQVKLLRVLESRKFERVGENEQQDFKGKVIASTNRNLAVEIKFAGTRSI